MEKKELINKIKFKTIKFPTGRVYTLLRGGFRTVPAIILAFSVIFTGEGRLSAQSAVSDLRITGMTISSNDIHVNDLVKVTVTVQNDGPAIESGFRVDLFKNSGGLPQGDKRGDLSYLVKRLDAGGSMPIDFVYRAEAGSYSIFVVIDTDRQINETNETNNTSTPLPIYAGPAREDDIYENNDTIAQAKTITSAGNAVSLVSKDADYFKVSATAGSYIEIEMNYDELQSRLDIVLMNTNGMIVKESEGSNGKKNLLYRADIAGDYIIFINNGTSDNNYLLELNIGKLPELSISINDIKIEGPYVSDDDFSRYEAKIKVQIRNTGAPLKYPVYVDLFRNENMPPKPGEFGNITTMIRASDFSENGYGIMEAVVTFTDSELLDGIYTLYAMVDSDNLLRESDENNNISAAYRMVAGNGIVTDDVFDSGGRDNDQHPANMPGSEESRYVYIKDILLSEGAHPKLTARDDDYYSVKMKQGESMRVSLNFIDEFGDLDLYLYSSTNAVNILKSSITAGNQEVITWTNTGPEAVYILKVEPREVNPEYSLNLSLYPEIPNIDITVSNIKISPISPGQGESIKAIITVMNSGSEDTGSFRVDFFSKTGNMAPPVMGDISEIYGTVLNLKGGESMNVEITLPVTEGTARFYATADTAGTILESNKSNNIYGPKELAVAGGSVDDALEKNGNTENDSGDNAVTIGYFTYSYLKALDDDWYRIDLAPGKVLRATMLYEESRGNLAVALYKNENGEYIRLSEGDEFLNGEVTEYANDTQSVMTVYVKVNPFNDANGYTLTMKETNVSDTGDKGNIAIISAVTLPLNKSEGDIIRTTVAVKNTGKVTTAADFYVDIYTTLNAKPEPGTYGDLFELVPAGIKPGETAYVIFEYKLNRGTHKIYIVADTEDVVTEISKADNLFGPVEMNVAGNSVPDIIPKKLTINVTGNTGGSGTVEVQLDIENRGSADTGDINVLFSLVEGSGTADEREVMTWPAATVTGNLPAGGTLNGKAFELDLDGYVPRGKYRLIARLDFDDTIAEKDEWNNVLYSSEFEINEGNNGYVFETYPALTGNMNEAETIFELYDWTPQAGSSGFDLGKVDPSELTLIRTGGSNSAVSAGLKPGFYFIRIFGRGSITGDYSFFAYPGNTSRSGIEDTDPKNPAQYEPNNVPSLSNIFIMNNGKVQKQSISTASDEDWIYFEIK